MKKLLFAVITLLLFTENFAQITQVARKEMEMDDEGVGNTTPVGDKGVLIHGWVTRKGEPDVWKISQVDENFFEKNTSTIAIPDKYYSNGYIKSEDNKMLYILFANKKNEFQLSSYNTEKLQTNSVTGAMPSKFYVTGLALLNNSLFVKGYMKKDQMLVVIDCASGKASIVVLPGAGLKMNIQDMEPDNKQGIMAVSVTYGKGKKVMDKIFQTCFFNASGEKIDEPFKIQNEPGNFTISSSVTWLSKNHFLVSGSYSSDEDFMPNGIYMAEFENGSQKFIKYQNFADLKNFLNYLSKNKQEKMQKKIAKKKEKGKDNIIEAYITTHPVCEFNGEYVLIGEVYFPTYRQVAKTTYVNGKPQTTYQTVFDGYQYSHATVITMDKSGNKTSDYCFEMWLSYKPFWVVKNLRGVYTADDMRLFFSTGTELKSMTIKKGNTYSESNLGKITTDKEGDKVKWTGFTESYYWYDNYFICYGSQRIKNEDDNKKRTVFFVSKIKVN